MTSYTATGPAGRFQAADLVDPDPNAGGRLRHKFNTPEVAYEDTASGNMRRRPIEWLRTLYRRDNLNGLLPLGDLQPLALPGESYRLAFTPGLLNQVFKRPRPHQAPEALLPAPADVLAGQSSDRGGYLRSQVLKADGRFSDSDPDDHWWIPSGQIFYSPKTTDLPLAELTHARSHFFLPHRYRDPFGQANFVSYDSNDDNLQKNHNLLAVRTEDAVCNAVAAVNDYRLLQPVEITDPNGNRSEVRFDALGMVVGTAVRGKAAPTMAEEEGDSFDNFVADLTTTQIEQYFGPGDPRSRARAHLGTATTRIIYDLDRIPASAATIARETHVSDLDGHETKLQLSFSYFDGFGREIQKKIQAEKGPVPQRDADGKIILGADGQPRMTPNDISPRWVGSGWTIFSNKGKPVRQFEPFFTDTHRYEFDVKIGVSPWLFYDPVERVVATLHPNHSWEKVVFDPWQQTTHDVNDTVLISDPSKTDPDMADYFRRLPDSEYLPSWHGLRTVSDNAAAFAACYPDDKDRLNETTAARKAAAHAKTPTTAHFDALGRPFLTVARNHVVCAGHDLRGTAESITTRVELDIEGNQRAVRDAVVQPDDALGRIVMRYDYDMLGNRIQQSSMEAGQRWMLNDAAGKPIQAWDRRGHSFRTAYDPLRRPLRSLVTGDDANNPNYELLTERLVYGEQHPQSEQLNLRGKLYLHLDQAGVVSNDEYEFKGNLLISSRRLTNGTQYKQTIDWRVVDDDHDALPLEAKAKINAAKLEAALASRLESATYTSRTTYNALNRPIQLVAPHSDQPGTKINVIQPVYNKANLLEQVHAWLNQAAQPERLLDPESANLHAVTDIDYDAKGQRTLIEYGSGASPDRKGVTTIYTYDPLTFRLTHLLTRRDAALFPGDCPQRTSSDWPGCQVQNLHYTYDPAGNITHIRDDGQQTIYFKNKRVDPSAEYTYDALYRLIEATGREHLGLTAVGSPKAPTPHSYNDAGRVRVASTYGAGHFPPNDGKAMGTYIERYVYDAIGNFISMKHIGSDPANQGWTRRYDYNETSLTEPGKRSNRLSSTTVGNGSLVTEPYSYDAHGNMLRMPQLQEMQWDYKDRLRMTCRQKVNDQDAEGAEHHGERTWYVYDAAGHRVRKFTERANNGGPKNERIYLGGFEMYRGHSGPNAGLVREALHIMDEKQRIALVETRNEIDDGTAKQLIRYQFSNHLGSAILELDDQAQIISYEEYTPYGSTSYQAVRNKTETPKRYRYTGKERDEESGLYYHGARYYAARLGRWANCDPAGIDAGSNLYVYVRSSPIVRHDPTGKADEQLWLWQQRQLTIDPVATRTARGTTPLQHAALRGMDYGFGPNEGAHWGHPEGQSFVTQPAGTQVTLSPEIAAENLKKAHLSKAQGQSAAATGGFKRVQSVDLNVPKGTRFSQPPPKHFEAPFASYESTIASEGLGGPFLPPDQAYQLRLNLDPPPPIGLAGDTQLPLNFEPPPAAPAVTSTPPTSPPPPLPEAPKPLPMPAAMPSVGGKPAGGNFGSRTVAGAIKALPKAAQIVGQITTVFGAVSEADRTDRMLAQHGEGAFARATNTAAVLVIGVAAGVADDAFAAAQTVGLAGAPVITQQSWEEHAAGPIQHAVGEAYRGILKWAWSKGL